MNAFTIETQLEGTVSPSKLIDVVIRIQSGWKHPALYHIPICCFLVIRLCFTSPENLCEVCWAVLNHDFYSVPGSGTTLRPKKTREVLSTRRYQKTRDDGSQPEPISVAIKSCNWCLWIAVHWSQWKAVVLLVSNSRISEQTNKAIVL